MKNLFFFFCFLGLFISCSDNDNDNDNTSIDLAGEWILSEVNNDPGDGSGEFTRVESNKNLVFKENKDITSNGELCTNSTDSESPTSGTYELNENSTTAGVILASKKISPTSNGTVTFCMYIIYAMKYAPLNI